MDTPITLLYKTNKTVFTSQDLMLLWQESKPDNLKAKIAYYVKRGALLRLTRGVFARDEKYDPRELATSMYTPSYISFETVLREAGIVFQHYDAIFVAAPWSVTKTISGRHTFTFRKLKDVILYNPEGILNKGVYSIASPERAFLDTIYLSPRYFFDNLTPLDWERCAALAPLYGNRALAQRLARYQQHAQ